MRDRHVLMFAALLALIVLILVFYGPWARVEFFQAFGLGDWAYRHLTTVDEKVAMINDHYNPGGQQMALSTGQYSGFCPFYSGEEMIWFISQQPFVLKVALQEYDLEDALPLERLDEDTLIFNSREFPITLTFTRTDPSPEDAASGHQLVSFFLRASRQQR